MFRCIFPSWTSPSFTSPRGAVRRDAGWRRFRAGEADILQLRTVNDGVFNYKLKKNQVNIKADETRRSGDAIGWWLSGDRGCLLLSFPVPERLNVSKSRGMANHTIFSLYFDRSSWSIGCKLWKLQLTARRVSPFNKLDRFYAKSSRSQGVKLWSSSLGVCFWVNNVHINASLANLINQLR